MNIIAKETEKEAEACIKWAAGRAFGIGLLPMGSDVLLSANEAYLFYRLATIYGRSADEKMWTMFLGCVGAEMSRLVSGKTLPDAVRAPLCAAVTYGVGKAIKMFFESGWSIDEMKVHRYELAEELQNGFSGAKKYKWKEVNRF